MKKLLLTAKSLSLSALLILGYGCMENKTPNKTDEQKVRLITLDPGHFHAALVQKSMYPEIDAEVQVYAPDSTELKAHLALIDQYNSRAEMPTTWKEKVYTGPDYLEKMIADKAGNVVVIAGNNKKKTDYIKKSVDAGFNVLADKPMAISTEGFNLLRESFAAAEKNKTLLYDIMTERFEINSMVQKALAALPEVFGELKKGDAEHPSVIKESAHFFFKYVSGKPLIRPSWFFDADQQGDGLVDITTHMVDLIQWSCFPEVALDYTKDINLLSSGRWPTMLTPAQFRQVTLKSEYPEFLKKNVNDSILKVYANGEMNYSIKGVHARVSVVWNFQAPEGTGDTHYSLMEGTKCKLVIRQNKEQGYKPMLYIEPANLGDTVAFGKTLLKNMDKINEMYPGITLSKNDAGWQVMIPSSYSIGHEAQFAEVTKKFLRYLKEGKLPDWEVPNMIAKYYTTTQALEKATLKQSPVQHETH